MVDAKSVTMTRGRVRVILIAAWAGTFLLLVYGGDVPPWLAFIGSLAGGVVIHNYAPPVSGEVLAPAEKALRIVAHVALYAVLVFFALVVVAITLGTLVTLLL